MGGEVWEGMIKFFFINNVCDSSMTTAATERLNDVIGIPTYDYSMKEQLGHQNKLKIPNKKIVHYILVINNVH